MRLFLLMMVMCVPRTHQDQIHDEILKIYGPPENISTERHQSYRRGVQSPEIYTAYYIDKNIVDAIFNSPLNYGNRMTVKPTVNTNNGDRRECQCVPNHLCDDPYSTRIGLIQIKFAEEGCKKNVEVCCTKIKPLTSQPVETPHAKKMKGCGYRNRRGISFNVVGGTVLESQFGEFPWVLALIDARNDSYIGVGVLIHPQVVLTSAHIASKYQLVDVKIRAGEWDTKTLNEPYGHQERRIQQIYVHSEFNPRRRINDLAVLHLETPVELDEHINTICLPDQDEDFSSSKHCVASGWVKDSLDIDSYFAVTLKIVELDVVEHSRCNTLLKRTRLGSRFNLHNSFICAGGKEGKDTCTGDGGGQLACPIGNDRYKLAGLVAGIVGCGQKDVPGLYSSLPTLRAWVDEKMYMLGYDTSYYNI